MSKGVTHFKAEAEKISESFPELKFEELENKALQITGELVLRDQEGLYIDTYNIRIEPHESYPLKFPKVYETGGRIPINIDWHIFPDGHCCIKSLPEEDLICKNGINLVSFINGQVVPFFFNQKYREMHGFFLNERAHGLDGNIAFFEDVFNTRDLTKIARGLIYIKARKEPGRTSQCFCGENIKYRKCHRSAFKLLQVFSDEDFERYLNMIVSSPRFKMDNY